MRIFVDGIACNIRQITVNDGMNYGRFPETYSGEISTFELHITHQEFIDLMEPTYNQIRDEIKTDDSAFGDTSDFSRTGYVSLPEMFDHKKELSSIIFEFLDRILFSILFPGHPDKVYVINSTDEILISETEIKISGRVFRK